MLKRQIQFKYAVFVHSSFFVIIVALVSAHPTLKTIFSQVWGPNKYIPKVDDDLPKI